MNPNVNYGLQVMIIGTSVPLRRGIMEKATRVYGQEGYEKSLYLSLNLAMN